MNTCINVWAMFLSGLQIRLAGLGCLGTLRLGLHGILYPFDLAPQGNPDEIIQLLV